MLREFIQTNRDAILTVARARGASRDKLPATDLELKDGLPAFLEQLEEALRKATEHENVDHRAIDESARLHGHELYARGLTCAEVVHDYGDLCQSITGLLMEAKVDIDAEEFRTLNLCLDDAIAGAVTSYASHRERAAADEGKERMGTLAHEMRNALNVLMLAFASIKKGIVAPGGSTGALLERNLMALQTLINRSLADVRLDAGKQNRERILLHTIIEEVAVGGALLAETRSVRLEVAGFPRDIAVDVDREILASALGNLVQNAIKFTRAGTAVTLRVHSPPGRVVIDVEDGCGGLPPGSAQALLEPFVQRGADRSGLGLGLSICAKAMRASDGELRITDLPGQGCIFTLDLPSASGGGPAEPSTTGASPIMSVS